MADRKTLYLAIQAETEITREQLKQLGVSLRQAGIEADASLNKIERRFSDFGSRTRGSISSAFAGGFVGGLVSQLTTGLEQALGASVKFAQGLQQVSENTGASTKLIQELRYAVGQTGGDIAKVETGIGTFAETIGRAASGNKTAADAFGALGVSVTDANGKVRPLEAILRDTADALQRYPDRLQAGTLATQLFGSSASDLLPVLRQGSTGFDAYAAAAAKLGLVLGDDQLRKLDELGSKAEALKQQLSLELAAAIGANAESLLSLARALFEAAGGLARFAAEDPERIREIASAAGGAVAGGAIGGLQGAAIGGFVGYASTQDRQLRGSQILAQNVRDGFENKTVGTAVASIGVFFSSKETLEKFADVEARQKQRDALAANLDKTFPLAEFGTTGQGAAAGNAVNLRAKGVLDSLTQRAAASGDPRRLAIVSALQSAGVTPDSPEGQRISALAGQVYDQGPGAQRAAAEARRAAAAARSSATRDLAQRRAVAAGDQQVRRAELGVLAAQADATGDPAARFDVERQRIEQQRLSLREEITQRQQLGQLTAAQAERLRAAADETAAADSRALANREAARIEDEAYRLRQTELDGQRELLQAQLGLATTRQDRQRIEEQLIDLSLQQLREEVLNLKRLQALGEATQGQVDAAEARLKAAEDTAPLQREGVARQNEGPLARYRRSLEEESARIGDSFEQLVVNGLSKVDDALDRSISKIHVFGGVFDDVLNGILSDFTRLATHQLFKSLLGDSGGGGGDIFSSLFSGVLSLFGGGGGGFGGDALSGGIAVSGLGFASGGEPPVGMASLVGEKGPELFVPKVPGTVIPNHMLGGRGAAPNIYIDARGAYLAEEFQGYVQQVGRAAAATGAAGGRVAAASDFRRVTRPTLPGSRAA